MTAEEKALAFDAIADALTNHFTDDAPGGPWKWWCPNPAGGPRRATKAEAVASLVEWAKALGPLWAAKNERLASRRLPLPLAELEFRAEQERRGR